MLTTRVLAPNPGPMTLDGTNTYLVRRPGWHRMVVVDPGPSDPIHLQRIVSQGPVELILLTHHHRDHSEAASRLSAMSRAPVRSIDQALCVNGTRLVNGEEVLAGGTCIRVVATPGHTADSASFFLREDLDLDASEISGSMLTGDTILGRGSTVIAQPDGSLRAYLASLQRLTTYGSVVVLPGHGPRLDNLAFIARAYLDHRKARLAEVQSAIERLSASTVDGVSVAAITNLVYAGLPPALRFAAEASVKAQLEYLIDVANEPAARTDR